MQVPYLKSLLQMQVQRQHQMMVLWYLQTARQSSRWTSSTLMGGEVRESQNG